MEYKRALLKLLSDKFDRTALQGGQRPLRGGGLGLEDEEFDFSADVVLFGEIDAKLPVVIRGKLPSLRAKKVCASARGWGPFWGPTSKRF